MSYNIRIEKRQNGLGDDYISSIKLNTLLKIIIVLIIVLLILSYVGQKIQNEKEFAHEITISIEVVTPIITSTVTPTNTPTVTPTMTPTVKPTVAPTKTSRSDNMSEPIIMTITMYTLGYDECGKIDGITASGKMVRPNHTIAMGHKWKFGTKVKIQGFGDTIFVNEDRGGAIGDYCIDLYVTDRGYMNRFGRQKKKVWILN